MGIIFSNDSTLRDSKKNSNLAELVITNTSGETDKDSLPGQSAVSVGHVAGCDSDTCQQHNLSQEVCS